MRAKRTVRRQSTRRVKLTARDRTILCAVGEMKFLRTSQIAALCFGRLTSTVRLRLRCLLDVGLLKAWVPNLNHENVYSLGRKGLSVISDEAYSDGVSFTVPRRLDRRLEHLLCINSFRIALTQACRKKGGEILHWQSDWQLKQPAARGIVPDALFTVRMRTKECRFALEIDLGGEPARTVFVSKLRHYAASFSNEYTPFERLLVVTATLRRLSLLLEVAAKERGSADVFFTLREKIEPSSILQAIWTTPHLAYASDGPVQFCSLLDCFGEAGRVLYE